MPQSMTAILATTAVPNGFPGQPAHYLFGVLVDWGEAERKLTSAVSVLSGADNGAYPAANSLLVKGAGETVLIDPSVSIVAKGGAPVAVDALINSHSHEDHVAGNGLYSSARVHVHEADLPGVRSVEGLMDVYGLEGEARASFT